MSNGNRESLLHRPMTNQMTPLSLLHRSPETGNGEWGLTALVVVSQRLHRCTPVNVLHILKGYSSIVYVWELINDLSETMVELRDKK